MKMNGYKLNLTAKTLTITKEFEEAIAQGEGKAYELYTKFLRDIPGLTVIRKTHKTPSKYPRAPEKSFAVISLRTSNMRIWRGLSMAFPTAKII